MWLFIKELKKAFYVKIILTVHDELVVEVDSSFADKMKQIVIKTMELNQPLKVPILVEAGVGDNWATAK